MRRVAILFTAAMVLSVSGAFASPSFEEANAKYRSGDFKAAAEAYKELAASGADDAAVNYNLGNALFRLGRRGEAVAAYERALAAAPRDPDILWNLDVVRSTLVDKIEPPAGDVASFLVRRVLERLSLGEAAAASLGFALAFFLFAAVSYARPSKGMRALTGIALALFVAAAAVYAAEWNEARRPRAVVVKKEAIVRYGPSLKETKAFTLHEGAIGREDDETGEWMYLSLANGTGGWVPKASLERV